ncbi:MAG: 30S ribosomal protein S1 [Mariprofundaceae bacterium]|nr:30S ribosomal protein S1 [Mariprofundaceae bacterium]
MTSLDKDISKIESETKLAKEEENFAQLLEDSLRSQPIVEEGHIVKGYVLSVQDEEVTIDVGLKGEGIVSISEFAGVPVPESGTEVDVLIRNVGGKKGLDISVREAIQRQVWDTLEVAEKDGSIITGTIEAEVKGGYRVNLGALSAFMPKSETDTDMHANLNQLLGSACEVIILSLSRRPENIVVSRKKPMAAQQELIRKAFFEKVQVGDQINGEVKRLVDFGAFVDIGGVDALLHVSDISWRHINHPQEMLSVGQAVVAEIIKADAETGKISISMRTLQVDPWANVAEKYQQDMRLTGTVRRLLDFGVMVELEPGVEGMIHRSEMSWLRKDIQPASVVTQGDVVDVAVMSVDSAKRRIALSLKEVMENPWQAWLTKNPVGTKVEGVVRNITTFGLFVELDEGLDGLVHLSNFSWEKQGSEVIGEYSSGQEVEAVVLGVDIDRQRISLGFKQTTADPLDVFLEHSGKSATVEGEIFEVQQFVALVHVTQGVDAVLPMREVPRDQTLSVGEKIEAKVIDTDKRRRKIVLSIRQLLKDEERDALRSYSQNIESDPQPSALALELQRKFLK